jgi:hypothetical protein
MLSSNLCIRYYAKHFVLRVLTVCPSPCSLSTFIDVTRQLYPQDWKSECYPSLVTQLTGKLDCHFFSLKLNNYPISEWKFTFLFLTDFYVLFVITESVIGLTATLITVIIALVIVAGVVCWYNRQPSDAYSDIYDE